MGASEAILRGNTYAGRRRVAPDVEDTEGIAVVPLILQLAL
jgi:hypothetical protein